MINSRKIQWIQTALLAYIAAIVSALASHNTNDIVAVGALFGIAVLAALLAGLSVGKIMESNETEWQGVGGEP